VRILLASQIYLDGCGSGIYTQNLATQLMEQGHEVRVLAGDNTPVTGRPFPVRTLLYPSDPAAGRIDGIEFNVPIYTNHRLSSQTIDHLDPDQLDRYLDRLRRTLTEEIESFRPELVHVQHASMYGYLMAEMDVPYVITLHGTDLMSFRKGRHLRERVLIGAHHAQRLIAVSAHTKAEALQLLRLRSDKVEVVLNGYDEKLFHPRAVARPAVLERLGLSGDDTRPPALVSFVGKLTGFKGIDVLLDAAAQYEGAVPGVITAIVGDGELRQPLEEQARRLGLQGVRFLGHRTQNELAELYTVADVSVVPSRHEPFGLVAIEAMACGTPVVATRAGGLVDFVDDRVGRLVPMEDPGALAGGITAEIRGESKLTKGPFCASYARDGFSSARPAQAVDAIYRLAAAASSEARFPAAHAAARRATERDLVAIAIRG
jgi:glycosyltransferase involved in cell wall biosynthesis